MIIATFKTENDHISEISTSGHANYAEHGKDIVCAAVSAVFTGLINEIVRYARAEYEAGLDGAVLKIQTPNKNTQVLAEYVLHTIKDIAEAYPGNVTVEINVI